MPLVFAPGEAYRFDWSHEIGLIGGVMSTVKVAHLRLCRSRMLFVRAYAKTHPHAASANPNAQAVTVAQPVSVYGGVKVLF